ncbi:hypothetical protein CAPTEDRAFT_210808 [Capitella teleta]|uniref:Uncharacterized protein n=1 Tax=Capitella teleta TaxID=283909 RepID=R7U9P8_CAPTE|nr:hypothetical protein CAPTEDRAFT_210808 [Capitella teleta]|eukprot:ELT99825.1 hypothetical protein CAPTEDRAFT_210808 [Capitella teleta]
MDILDSSYEFEDQRIWDTEEKITQTNVLAKNKLTQLLDALLTPKCEAHRIYGKRIGESRLRVKVQSPEKITLLTKIDTSVCTTHASDANFRRLPKNMTLISWTEPLCITTYIRFRLFMPRIGTTLACGCSCFDNMPWGGRVEANACWCKERSHQTDIVQA